MRSSLIKIDFQKLIIISILMFFLGYSITGLITKEMIIGNMTPFHESVQKNPGGVFFLKHNLGFFFLVTILPFINIPILLIQLFISGVYAYIIRDLPLYQQFIIYYRHFALEYIALIMSTFVSYFNYEILKKMHRDRKYYWRNDVILVLRYYVIILILTLFAAFLEGGVRGI